MIPFQILCEELTVEQMYSYFHLTEKAFAYLTDEDKTLVYIQQLNSGSYRLFYPKEKYIQQMHGSELLRLIDDAIELGDFEKITLLKKELKRRKDNNIIDIPSVSFTNREIEMSAQLTNVCKKCNKRYPVVIKTGKKGVCSDCEQL